MSDHFSRLTDCFELYVKLLCKKEYGVSFRPSSYLWIDPKLNEMINALLASAAFNFKKWYNKLNQPQTAFKKFFKFSTNSLENLYIFSFFKKKLLNPYQNCPVWRKKKGLRPNSCNPLKELVDRTRLELVTPAL